MHGADVLIGPSLSGILSVRDVKRMRDPIVLAMAHPDPEIRPEEAERHVRVTATGRSDYPNQINNVLGFPGFFRGLLGGRVRIVDDETKLGAARALAGCVSFSRRPPEESLHRVPVTRTDREGSPVERVSHGPGMLLQLPCRRVGRR